ncbi:MAG: sugar phosphate isomerase/epimerase, partial [Lentisphaeria bacterium]|nr:sugar phosphate isomerase/epimerase [Lentisphaeria bacterium]
PDALARAHRAKGYTAAYAPRVSLDDPDRIRAYRDAFARAGVLIAEVGYWDNLLDTDAEIRMQHRRRMLEALALADALGARCAVDILGSYCRGRGPDHHSARNFSSEAFDEAVELARFLIDEVNPSTACFAYEIFPFNVVDSPTEIARLIRAVDRPRFGVHLDLANLINGPRAYFASGDVMRECVRLFGNRIVAAHVKDIRLREPAISVILEEVPAGEGGLDLAAFAREVQALPQEVPFMLEHLQGEEQYDRAAAHVRKVAAAEGIEL